MMSNLDRHLNDAVRQLKAASAAAPTPVFTAPQGSRHTRPALAVIMAFAVTVAVLIPVSGLLRSDPAPKPGASQTPTTSTDSPVIYLEGTSTMRYTFELAAKGAWLVASYVIVGEVVEVGEPRWNTTTGLRWEDDPGKVVPLQAGAGAGSAGYPLYFQEVTVKLIEQISGPSFYDDPDYYAEPPTGPALPEGPLVLTEILGLDWNAESSRQMVPKEAIGHRGLFVILLMEEFPMKDGTLRRGFEVADQASYLEVAPNVAIPIEAFGQSRHYSDTDPKSLAERMVEAAQLVSVTSATHDLVSFEELRARALNPDVPLEQHLGYADIRPLEPTATTIPATATTPPIATTSALAELSLSVGQPQELAIDGSVRDVATGPAGEIIAVGDGGGHSAGVWFSRDQKEWEKLDLTCSICPGDAITYVSAAQDGVFLKSSFQLPEEGRLDVPGIWHMSWNAPGELTLFDEIEGVEWIWSVGDSLFAAVRNKTGELSINRRSQSGDWVPTDDDLTLGSEWSITDALDSDGQAWIVAQTDSGGGAWSSSDGTTWRLETALVGGGGFSIAPIGHQVVISGQLLSTGRSTLWVSDGDGAWAMSEIDDYGKPRLTPLDQDVLAILSGTGTAYAISE